MCISNRFMKKKQSNKMRPWRAKAVTRRIPIDIVESVLMCMNPKDVVRLSTTCKEWRVAALRFDITMSKTPWLFTVADDSYILQNIIDENMSFKIRIPDFLLGRKFINDSSYGWLVLKSKQNGIITLLNPFSRAQLDLPALANPGPVFLHMSSPPTKPDCVVLLVDVGKLYVWRPGDTSWNIEENMDIKYYMSTISLQGQFYAIAYPYYRLITFQVLPLRVRKLNVPPPMDIRNILMYDVFLVESCGEILLVCIRMPCLDRVGHDIFMLRHNMCDKHQVILFRLDLKNETWIKIESLGDQTLFLKNNIQAMSISAHDAKCYGNCMYSINQWSRDVYIIKKNGVNIIATGSQSIIKRFWITPSLI